MRTRNSVFFFSFLLIFSAFALAEGTRTWEQSSFADLSKGTAKGVAIRSRGGLELAPSFKAITTTPSTYIWAIATDQAGNLYAAAGAPARIYRITPDGKSIAIFQPQELQVQALVVDKSGIIYAATNPDGKLYKITPPSAGEAKDSSSPWHSSVLFDPGTKYIWDLALDASGNIYVATGDHGEIFRVTPSGDHSVFFKSDEAHIRALTFDHQGNLIAGSDGSGLVYRVSPKGEAFVLYSASKKEITAVAVDKDGNIYAAGSGEKQATPAAFQMIPTPTINVTPAPSGNAGNPTVQATPAPVPVMPNNFPETGNSEVYKIAPDGSPTKIWTSHDELIYALAFDTQGRLLAGTGNHGRIFAIKGDDDYANLLQASASQVTAFAKTANGSLYAATSNLGKIYLLGASPNTDGTYESDVFDAHNFTRWGRLEFRGKGNVDLFARSGNVDNPDRNWSAWQKVDLANGKIAAPSARFIQWKAQLRPGDLPPRVDSVIVNYLPKNVSPDFDDVNVQVGVRYPSMPKVPGQDSSVVNPPPPTIHDANSIGVKWAVHDDNGDQMEYSLYYRGDGESRWLLLKDSITDKFYSFDASLLPDGGYTMKVVASDAPSHSPGEGLTAERGSARFEVDTTPPLIEGLTAAQTGNQLRIQFHATDSFSNIKRAEYSVDASDWQFIEPVDQLSDSKTESYDFRAAIPAQAAGSKDAGSKDSNDEHIVVVRVYDHYDNVASAKYVLRMTGK